MHPCSPAVISPLGSAERQASSPEDLELVRGDGNEGFLSDFILATCIASTYCRESLVHVGR